MGRDLRISAWQIAGSNFARTIVMKHVIRIGVAGGFLAVAVAAHAVGLSETDFAYLTTQNIERSSPPIHDLSPKEQARLHSLINDPRTANDPDAQAKYVNEALAEFLDHQLSGNARTRASSGMRRRSADPRGAQDQRAAL
jgi:hypothetical protein